MKCSWYLYGVLFSWTFFKLSREINIFHLHFIACSDADVNDIDFDPDEVEALDDEEETISEEEEEQSNADQQQNEDRLLAEANEPLENLLPPEYLQIILSQPVHDLQEPPSKKRRTSSRNLSSSHEEPRTENDRNIQIHLISVLVICKSFLWFFS